ncbi:RidA family protein [Candidatus Protofrankia californiensis]|uniref:RidA family protein n=1 Tax=Candidatus Protofrankia californiensis TaxID=1839754 RepID=UPI001041814F|nr:RidA family protein [Candidatus Protofrankia californiensis]
MLPVRIISHFNPDTLHSNPAFSQVIAVESPAKMIYIGGQNAVSRDGKIVGEDLATQSVRALENVLTALESVGANQENVVKLTIYVRQDQPLEQAFSSAQRVWGAHPTTISVVVVSGFANPQFLIEIDAVAAVEA